MGKVFITGGTGLVGSHLAEKLRLKGYAVEVWNRHRADGLDGLNGLMDADYIVHLAGANIGEKRWTAKRKKEIIDSRVKTAQKLFNHLKTHTSVSKTQISEVNTPTAGSKTHTPTCKLKAFISASAVGYYGSITRDELFEEDDAPATDFLGETCRLWEEAADEFQKLGARVVKLRTGLVLSKQGGALEKMVLPVKLGFASPLGSGKQYVPWIHIEDLCNLYLYAIEHSSLNGAYNASSPAKDTNASLMKDLATALQKPFWAPNVPAFALKALLGEQANLVLEGSPVSTQKILQTGFQFQYPDLPSALSQLYQKQ